MTILLSIFLLDVKLPGNLLPSPCKIIPAKHPIASILAIGEVSTESEPWGGVAEETEGMSPGGSKLSTHRSHTHWAKYVHIGGQGGANDGHMGGRSGADFMASIRTLGMSPPNQNPGVGWRRKRRACRQVAPNGGQYAHIGGKGGANYGHMGGTSGANFPYLTTYTHNVSFLNARR